MQVKRKGLHMQVILKEGVESFHKLLIYSPYQQHVAIKHQQNKKQEWFETAIRLSVGRCIKLPIPFLIMDLFKNAKF